PEAGAKPATRTAPTAAMPLNIKNSRFTALLPFGWGPVTRYGRVHRTRRPSASADKWIRPAPPVATGRPPAPGSEMLFGPRARADHVVTVANSMKRPESHTSGAIRSDVSCRHRCLLSLSSRGCRLRRIDDV